MLDYFSTPNRRAWGFFTLAMLLAMLLIPSMFPLPSDVGQRYVPMAEAFAAGDFRYAFHPRFPPLLSVLGGAISWCTGLNAAWAVQLAGTLFFAFSAMILYGIFRRIFTEKVAVTGTLIYIIASRMLRIASSGFRESGKALGFFLAVYGLFTALHDPKRCAGYLQCAAGCALMSYVRGDSVVFALCFLGTLFVGELAHALVPWRSISCGILYLLLMSPLLYCNAVFTGYYVPEVRFMPTAAVIHQETGWNFLYRPGSVLEREKTTPEKHSSVQVMKKEDFKKPPTGYAPVMTAPENVIPYDEYRDPTDVLSVFRATGKGIVWYLAIPAFIVIFQRLRRREWTRDETVLFCFYLGHGLLVFLMILAHDRRFFMDRRYLEPVAPLAYGWSAIAWLSLMDFLKRKTGRRFPSRKAQMILLGAVMIGFLLDAAAPALRNFCSRRRHASVLAVRRAAKWIRSDYDRLGLPRHRAVKLDLNDYRSCNFPSVRGADGRYASECGPAAGGQNAWQLDRSDYILLTAKLMGVYSGYENYRLVYEFEPVKGYKYCIFRRKDLQ